LACEGNKNLLPLHPSYFTWQSKSAALLLDQLRCAAGFWHFH